MRLTVESAEKLTWYESADLIALTERHNLEKQAVLEYNAVLRAAVSQAGIDPEDLPDDLDRRQAIVRSIRESDDGVNRALVLSLLGELRKYRAEEAAPRKGLGLAEQQNVKRLEGDLRRKEEELRELRLTLETEIAELRRALRSKDDVIMQLQLDDAGVMGRPAVAAAAAKRANPPQKKTAEGWGDGWEEDEGEAAEGEGWGEEELELPAVVPAPVDKSKADLQLEMMGQALNQSRLHCEQLQQQVRRWRLAQHVLAL